MALDALPGTGNGVNAAAAATSPRQRYIQGFLRQAGFERLRLNGLAARAKKRLDLLLCLIDQRTGLRAFPRGQFAETFELFGKRPGLSQEAGLCLLQLSEIGNPLERGFGIATIFSSLSMGHAVLRIKKGGPEASFSAASPNQAPRLAFA